MTIGVVGLGKMGSAFTRRLLSEGYSVSVWDRSAQPREALAAAGAAAYVTLSGLVAKVDVVIVMLWGDEVAREVTLGQVLPALHSGQLLIEMSTLSPGMYETLERAAKSQNVDFVAAPVLGNPDAVRDGALTVLPGGAEQSVQRAHAVLSALGKVIPMPSVRASAYLKLANNTVLGVIAETLGELFELCDRAGIDRDPAVQLLTGTFARAAQQKTQPLLSRDSQPRFALSALLKDLHLAQQAAASVDLSLPVLQAVVPKAEAAVENGLGDRDYIVLALERTRATMQA
jgi:3-hydroxyisobutyrate dehydrogenase